MVPPYVEFIGGVTAGVVLALKAPLIIICSRNDCAVMDASSIPERVGEMPGVRHWMGHGFAVRNRMLRRLRRGGR